MNDLEPRCWQRGVVVVRQALYPSIEIELVVGNVALNLSRLLVGKRSR